LRVEAHSRTGEIILAFSGDADVSTAPLLAHALTQATDHGHARVTIDLTGLEFIDTHCLSLIFGAHERIRDAGAALVLRAPRPPVRRLLEILEREDLIETTSQPITLIAL
jgi:anti-anti-sigma factor